MCLAGTKIRVTALASLRYAGQIKIEGDTWVGTKPRHNGLPFRPVGLDPAPLIQMMRNVVSDFMRHCIAQVYGIVFREYPGVVTNPVLLAKHFEHPGGGPAQIKFHRY